FFDMLSGHETSATSTKNAIGHLKKVKFGAVSDHEWPKLKTINKYKKYYRTGKFGWHVLNWNEPAPSFGNIMKTYILHPDSFEGGDMRVISVREAMLLMGFPKDYHFPKGIGLGARYQMVADSVSPVFSNIAAKIIYKIIS
ncbi:MAG: DNA cytosine methyltransferase, partial [Candidatus Parvarchaeum sp.]